MVVEGGVRAPLLEVPFESRLRCLMQGHEAALAKFSTSNHQTIWRDVVKSKVDRFGHSQPCAGQQGKQRAVGYSTDSMLDLGGCGDKLPGLLASQNVRGWSPRSLSAENRWWHFMAFVFGAQIAGESNDHPKPTGALRKRPDILAHSMAILAET